MGLYGTGLPTDQALLSDANIRARVQEYKDAGIRERTDFLRAQAGLDLTNGVPVAERYAAWKARRADGESASDGGDGGTGEDGPGDGSSGGGGNPSRGGPSGGNPSGGSPAGTGPALPAIVNLTAPLATILGRADRPGEAPAFGALDPALIQDLVNAAARNPRSRFCLTLTSPEGYAMAHGCARLIRGTSPAGRGTSRTGRGTSPAGRARDGPVGTGWDFTRDTARPGPKGGYGAWVLKLPSGAKYRVDLYKIPVHDCDHALATGAYRPSSLLRHLVEVRDGECTSVSCSHPARLCDFEHATP